MPERRRTKVAAIDAEVGRRTRKIRSERGWSQPDLAARIVAAGGTGWTSAIVAGLELGRRGLRLDEFAALCVALETRAETLLAGTDELAKMRVEPGPWTDEDPAITRRRFRAEEVTASVVASMNYLLGTPGEKRDISTDLRARERYDGRDILAERDRRYTEKYGDSNDDESRAQRLGHITKAIAWELAADTLPPGADL